MLLTYQFSAINLAGVVVAPTEEASIAYSFTPDLMLEARSFGLFVELYYHDEVLGFHCFPLNLLATAPQLQQPYLQCYS